MVLNGLPHEAHDTPLGGGCRCLNAQAIGRLARIAAEQEASASPKPGLVCPDHQGAHRDMDYLTFLASAAAIEPCFARCAALGQEHAVVPPERLLPLLRICGQQGEQAMLHATGGVNTHKGLLFSLGLVCAALGRLQGRKSSAAGHDVALPPAINTARTVTAEAAVLAGPLVERELLSLRTHLPPRPLTAGERLFLLHGITGIRGEAAQGFPAVRHALHCLLQVEKELPPAQALPHVLLELMSITEDSNIVWRGGTAALRFMHRGARAALRAGGMYTARGQAMVLALRDVFTRRRLSPGGCADLLALTIFFSHLERKTS